MDPLLEEYLVEEHRNDIQREARDIRLQKQAGRGKVFRPTLSTRILQGFGRWLIDRGEGLVKRYEVPTQKRRPSNRGFAH